MSPGVLQRVGDLALLQHRVERLRVVGGELVFVVVHEVRVRGVWNAVDLAVSAGDRIDHRLRVLFFHLLGHHVVDRGDGVLVEQIAKLVVGEHVHIGSRGRVGLHGLGCVTLGDHGVLPRHLVFGVGLAKGFLHVLEPLGILGRTPHGQVRGLRL